MGLEGFNFLNNGSGFFSFMIKSCKEARILLDTDPVMPGILAYEVVIGLQNNRSFIRGIQAGNTSDYVEERTPGFLSCTGKLL